MAINFEVNEAEGRKELDPLRLFRYSAYEVFKVSGRDNAALVF